MTRVSPFQIVAVIVLVTSTRASNASIALEQSLNNASSVMIPLSLNNALSGTITQSLNNASSLTVESIAKETTSTNLNYGNIVSFVTRPRLYEKNNTNVMCTSDTTVSTHPARTVTHPPSQINRSTTLCVSTVRSDDPLPYTSLWQYKMRQNIFKYGPPILLIFGNIGNLLSVITLMGPAFRSSSTSFILTTLAVMDTGVIDTGLMRQSIITLFGVDIRLFSEFSCKFHILLTYYLHHLSSWTLVLLTAERVISVYFPLRCKQLCSKRRTVAVWFIIAAVLLAINSNLLVTVGLIYPASTSTTAHNLSTDIPGQSIPKDVPTLDDSSVTFNPTTTYNWTSLIKHYPLNLSEIFVVNSSSVKTSRRFSTIATTAEVLRTVMVDHVEDPVTVASYIFQCSPYKSMWWFFYKPWYWMDAFLGDFIPFGVVFFGNVAIVTRIVGAQNKRADQMRVVAKNGKKVASTTSMLIFVGLLFLVLSLPYDIYYLGYAYQTFPLTTNQDQANSTLFYAVTSLLYYSNSAFNFLFYFISGQKFRTAFCAVICCGRRGNGKTSRGANKSTGNGRQTRASGATNSEMSVTL